ncbi:molybdenum cofactor sulfurase [Agaricicola taiwanensis]|uniref:Molybdenum cofactor sulfurase n=1 Tax=Agaricicola taiwanensis TaxID=591372 RepID=A0A8J2VXU0_9RHOB|nr:MOSC domain-containing protein [Agaricicola taiwanensis]GGE41904.1 molybdenum cofactor sulfurase [Agaricicola taiwanensis]
MSHPHTFPARTFKAQVVEVLVEGNAHPETRRTGCVSIDFEGMGGSRHYGYLRKAGPREPWYKRGSLMRSGRQITLVSREELAAVADAMQIERLEAAWIGANVVVEGLPDLSWLPAATRIVAPSGLVFVVEGQNAPCRIAGKAIARHVPVERRAEIDRSFAKAAAGQRGLVASVERPGDLRSGDALIVKVGKQWIYDPQDQDQGRLF